jgi:hypothetical protein
MGNRKKLDMVMASKTSLTPTEIRIPRSEKAMPERIIVRKKEIGRWIDRPMIGMRKIVMTKVIARPNTVLPRALPKRMVRISNGARRRRSRAPILFSKVITIAAMEVHEKRSVKPTNPGTTSLIPIGFLK